MSRNIGNETVAVAYTFGNIDPAFHHSLLRLKDWDSQFAKRLSHPGWLVAVGTTNIADGRCKAVQAFLEATTADWLWFIDTDQVFEPDVLERMIQSADPVERPILSALVMARRPERDPEITPACVVLAPTDPPMPVAPTMIPAERHWPVAAVGCGCVLIHRSVLEKVGKAFKGKTPLPWFEFSPWRRQENGVEVLDLMGEDYTFCFRAAHVGFGSTVDTTIHVGHNKTVTLTASHFWAQVPTDMVPPKNFVVIPVKDNLKMTKALLRQLYEQGNYEAILVFDNGSNPETKRWLANQTIAEVIDAEGAGIHQMWNRGAEIALERWPKVNIAFLNNDLRIGENFLAGLAEALRSERWGVVCPNYDNRPGEGVQRLHGICADKYDGTGGLSGFAYMVRGECFAEGYRFPEDAMWWFGDNDLTLSLDHSDVPYGMVLGTTVEHIDGGGKTGDWDAYKQSPQFQRDLAAFMARWPGMRVQAAS